MTTSLLIAALKKSQSTGPESPAGAWGLLGLRVTTGLLIFYIHGWHKLLDGIAYLLHGTPWKLVEEVAAMHFPAPRFSAFAATGVQFVCAALLIPGLYTRLNALLLAVALGGAVLQNLLAGRDPQLAVLYTLNVVALTMLGGGRYSLDARLSRCGSVPAESSVAVARHIQP